MSEPLSAEELERGADPERVSDLSLT